MNKIPKRLAIVTLILLAASFAVIKPASAAITGSEHDFTGASWNSGADICQVCHTPHNSSSTIAPLWNHTLSTATYTIYSSPSLNAAVGQPSSSSKACLSCHDGTVALDSFGGNVGSTIISGSARLDNDLSNDHPVSFTYDTALAAADGTLHDPAIKTVAALGGRTVDNAMLIGHKLECGSCHDVHANKGDAGTTGSLLLVRNTGSALCLTCHNK